MKYFALPSILGLLLAAATAHATPINPLTDGFTLNVGNTVLSNANASFDSGTGTLSFSDATSTYTFAETNVSPLISGLSITRTCVTLNLGGCASSVVSVSNANVLNGALQASALVGVTLQASAQAGVSNLAFASTTASLGAETALVGYPAAAASVTPEPSSLVLLGTGALGLAQAFRRRRGAFTK